MDTNFLNYCVKAGVFEETDLKSALNTLEEGVSIYETLIRKQYVTQEELAVAAGEYYDCPVVDLSRVSPEPQAIKYGSSLVCRHLLFLPFVVDISAGLLIAIADYSLKERVIAYLKEMRVERMMFYIAPYETLRQTIISIYGTDNSFSIADNSQLSNQSQLTAQRRRRSSILRTQGIDFDISKLRKEPNNVSSSVPSDEQMLKTLTAELAACREENHLLRQRVEQLSASVELESVMIRELAKILKSTGVLDSSSFERWLTSLR